MKTTTWAALLAAILASSSGAARAIERRTGEEAGRRQEEKKQRQERTRGDEVLRDEARRGREDGRKLRPGGDKVDRASLRRASRAQVKEWKAGLAEWSEFSGATDGRAVVLHFTPGRQGKLDGLHAYLVTGDRVEHLFDASSLLGDLARDYDRAVRKLSDGQLSGPNNSIADIGRWASEGEDPAAPLALARFSERLARRVSRVKGLPESIVIDGLADESFAGIEGNLLDSLATRGKRGPLFTTEAVRRERERASRLTRDEDAENQDLLRRMNEMSDAEIEAAVGRGR
jgi:hypothetical protein